jgi:hypothetical protein
MAVPPSIDPFPSAPPHALRAASPVQRPLRCTHCGQGEEIGALHRARVHLSAVFFPSQKRHAAGAKGLWAISSQLRFFIKTLKKLAGPELGR